MKNVELREADRVEVQVLVDNYIDWLMIESTETLKRPLVPPGKTLLAEHGLSFIIKVCSGTEEHWVMMDAGVSPIPVLHNIEALDVDLSRVEAVVLSHGHIDHFGGLMPVAGKLKKGTTLVLHPDALLQRRINVPGLGAHVDFPRLDGRAFEEAGMILTQIRGPSALASGLIVVLAKVERVTDYEKGFPWAEARIDGDWIVDPFHDDLGVAIKVRNKGIVVIGGCSHAGIINTVRYAQKITGTEAVEAVLGGFHLTGPIFEPIIMPTIDDMKEIGPNFVVPMHCTGWKAMNRFATEMPEQFLLNTVGTTYVFA